MQNILNKIIRWGIYALVFLMPIFFLPISSEIFEFNKQYLLFFGSSILLLVWLVKMVMVEKEFKFKWVPINIPILIFLLVAVLSAIFSIDKSNSILGFYGRFSDGLVSLASLIVLYFVVINNVKNNKDKKEIEEVVVEKDDSPNVGGIIKAFLWSSLAVVVTEFISILGFWQLLATLFSKIKVTFPTDIFNRIFNPLGGSPAGLAVFLAVVLVLCISLFFLKENDKKRITLLASISIFSLLMMILIDFTPAWIILAVSVLGFLIFSFWSKIFRKRIDWLLVPIIIFIVSVAFAIFNIPSSVKLPVLGFNILSQPQEVLLDQKTTWSTTINTVKNYPVLGSGIGTFSESFSKFKPQAFNTSDFWQIRFDRGGSQIAETIMTMGLLGFLGILGIIVSFFIIASLLISRIKKEREDSGFQLPLTFALFALIVAQFVYYQNITLAFLFWLGLGLYMVSYYRTIPEIKLSFKQSPEIALIFDIILILIGVAVLGLWFFGIKFYFADVKYKEGILSSNTVALEKAVNFNSMRSNFRVALSRSYFRDAAKEASSGKTDTATTENTQLLLAKSVDQARRAEKASPNWVVPTENLGMIYRDLIGSVKDVSQTAIDYFTKAEKLEPYNPVLVLEVGKIYRNDKKNTEAKEEFKKALQLKPNYVDGGVQLALTLEAEDSMGDAIAQLKEVITNSPLAYQGYFQLGRIYYNDSKVSDAISQLEKAAYLAPTNSNTLYILALAYHKSGDDTTAVKILQKVLELNPGNEDVTSKINEFKNPAPVAPLETTTKTK